MKAALFLHGFLSDPEIDFDKLILELDNYDHIEKIYYPGHGGEKEINYWDFYGLDTVLKVIEITDELLAKYETVDLFGYSLGGALAMYVASKKKINRLVLLAPAYKYINNSLFLNKLKFNAKYALKMNKEKKYAKEQLRIARENDFKATKFFIRKYFKLYIAKAYREFKLIISFVQRNTTVIDVPTLICYGTLDELVPRKSINAAMNKIINHNKKLNEYENMTHLMLASVNPEQMIKDIKEFIGAKYD